MDPLRTIVGVALAVAVGGCAPADSARRAKTAATQDVAGEVVTGKPTVPAIGAVAEEAVSGYMDRQLDQLQRELTAVSARQALKVTRLSGHAIRLGIDGDLSFDFNSAQIKPDALAIYAKIAAVLLAYDLTVVHIVSHTDASGSDPYNQELSRRRAAAVASYLGGQGLSGTRVRHQGRGESEPIANNNTADGRRRNRRVELVIKPVVKGQEQQAWIPPPPLGV